MTSIRPALLAAAAALAAAPAIAASAAAAPAASAWTLSADGGARQCRLVLRPAEGNAGAAVAMPPGCRHAFPELKRVALWSEFGEGLHLDDARGDTLLSFEADGRNFRGTTPQGEALALVSTDGRGRAALDAAAAPAGAEVAQAAGAPAAGKPATAKSVAAEKKAASGGPKPAEVAGRYAVLRDKTRDTGCMVTLDDKGAGPGNTLKARLAPACRDQGIVIFDPVGWRMVAGKLVLTARKGHTTELETQDDGTWMNDAKKGKTLSLKRI